MELLLPPSKSLADEENKDECLPLLQLMPGEQVLLRGDLHQIQLLLAPFFWGSSLIKTVAEEINQDTV